MRIFDGLNAPDLERKERVLAVGAFDGVHRGHVRLLGHVCRTAAEYGVESAIMTFEPVPAQVFRRRGRTDLRLTTADERARELSKQCLDTVVVVHFDQQFRQLSALDFARDVLVGRLGATVLVASKTHTFGRNAEADVQRITELGMELGFEVHVLPPILVRGELINSSEIRRRLWVGDLEEANQWLGRYYDLAGEVVPGRGFGRELGFATANLQPPPEKLVPGDGVYAGAARVEGAAQLGQWLAAAVSIGNTPTIGNSGRRVEAHLLDADPGDLHGQRVRLLFLSRLRPQIRFDTVHALAQQIARDVETTRAVFDAARHRLSPDDWRL